MKLLNTRRAMYHVKQPDISRLNNCEVRRETRVAKRNFLTGSCKQFLTRLIFRVFIYVKIFIQTRYSTKSLTQILAQSRSSFVLRLSLISIRPRWKRTILYIKRLLNWPTQLLTMLKCLASISIVKRSSSSLLYFSILFSIAQSFSRRKNSI